MKTAIIGGGPAGLYFAILLKKFRPESDITVYERNRADETFGFGVVFSDATLDNFERYDLPSYQRITREFAYWDDIAIHFRGTEHRLLRLLAPHAAPDPAEPGGGTRHRTALRCGCR
jgi:anthraniloyl-CoA monooxygenase